MLNSKESQEMSETHSTKRQHKKDGHLTAIHRYIQRDAASVVAWHRNLPLSP